MKKFFKVLMYIIILLVALVAAYVIYINVANEHGSGDIASNVEQDKYKGYLTLENYPKVDASLATQPLCTAFAEYFTGEKIEDDSVLEYSNTHPGYLALIDGKKDLIIVTEPSEEELAYAKSKNVELEITPVVREGFVFFVNADNPVDSLTIEQIQDIYSGKITNWSEVGGKNAKIRAFQRPENSGSQTGMLSLVMKDLDLIEPETRDLIGSMEDIVNMVADYDNGEYSIGYSYYYYATTMFEDINEEVRNNIKLLKINDIAPTNETIKAQEYPLETAYYIVTRSDEKEGSPVRMLCDAMLSVGAQKVAEEVGYVGVK